MIDDSSRKNFEYVLVYQLDRFARNRYDSATYKAKLKKNGVTLSKWTVYKYINDGVFLRLTSKTLPMGGKKKTEYKKV